MNVTNAKTVDGLDSIARIFCTGSYYIVICSVLFFPVYNAHWSLYLALFLEGAAVFCAGYAIQSAFSRLTGNKRVKNSGAYEPENRYFESTKAVLPALLSAAASLAVSVPFSYFLKREQTGTNAEWLIIPFFILAAVGGVVVWFYPTGRLASRRNLFVCSCVILATYILYSFTGLGAYCQVILLLVFAIFAGISVSYANITYNYMGDDSLQVNKSVKINCFYVLLRFFGSAVLCFILAASVFSGLTVLGRSLLVMILRIDYDNGTLLEGEELRREFNYFVYGEYEASDSPMFYFFILFIVLMLVGLAFLLLRHSNSFKDALKRIKKWFLSLWEEILYLLGKMRPRTMNNYADYSDYVDVQRKIEPLINEYNKRQFKIHKSYKKFMGELNSLPTDRDKIVYGYCALMSVCSRLPLYVKKSDTPRQARAKLDGEKNFENMGKITHAFEIAEYACREPEASAGREAIELICGVLKVYLDD